MKAPDEYLYDKLKALSDSDMYPFHMPGHKRNLKGHRLDALFEVDITEIDGFDNLHAPEGLLKEAMERAAGFYHSEQTYFLVNGSSSGVLSALMACADGGGKVLIGRNAHKSAYHALYLGRMKPVYLMPPVVQEYGFAGGIFPEDVRRALEREEDIRAVFLTSPTYDGILSDLKPIVEAAHERGIPVIVDEAHGAHLALFPEYIEKSAIACGADLVIQSIHKTLPAPTQTALLHINGNLADREKVERYLKMFQSSSPSYVLMAGMDECFRLLSEEGEGLQKAYLKNRAELDDAVKMLSCLRVYGSEGDKAKWAEYGIKDVDMGKLVISAKNVLINGKELYDALRMKYHLQMEMAASSYVLAMTTILDTREGFLRLAEALREIDSWLSKREVCPEQEPVFYGAVGPARMTLFEAQNAAKEWLPLSHAEGRIAAQVVNLYPPGIPLLVPGEEITGEFLDFLESCLSKQLNVQGVRREGGAWIPVVMDSYCS